MDALSPEATRLIHDLRNCVASVRAAANMLQQPEPDSTVVETVALGLHQRVKEMVRLLDTFAGRSSDEPIINTLPEPVAKETSLRILIADDNADAARTLATYLRLNGYVTQVAFDGAEAVQQATTEPPDVMLLDITMPTLSGHEVARQIRSQPWGAAVRLVAISGWFSDADKERAEQSGFDAQLNKPIDLTALLRLLQVSQ